MVPEVRRRVGDVVGVAPFGVVGPTVSEADDVHARAAGRLDAVEGVLGVDEDPVHVETSRVHVSAFGNGTEVLVVGADRRGFARGAAR